MTVLIVDGYTDEPSRLGVPPFIAPITRYIYGACILAEHDVIYRTIDHYRQMVKFRPKVSNWRKFFSRANILVVIYGATVPGTYITTRPASQKEIIEIAKNFNGTKILIGSGAIGMRNLPKLSFVADNFDFVVTGAPDKFIFDYLNDGICHNNPEIDMELRDKSLQVGAENIKNILNFTLEHTICEIDTYYGCHRYSSGGCSFCIEPLYGKPKYRRIEAIIHEIATLSAKGIRHFRIGGQSCILSYMAEEFIDDTLPIPNTMALEKLFRSIWTHGKSIKTLHVDNANPSVIASSIEGRRAVEIIGKYTTSGNVLAFGLESADPKVIRENNLNTTPELCMESIRFVNKIGRRYGSNGMPHLLPGINFVLGLKGETRSTLKYNMEFVRGVLKEGLWVRRINVRHVLPIRPGFKGGRRWRNYDRDIHGFREFIKNEIEKRILGQMLPQGHILKDVVVMARKGTASLGKQIGTYAITVVFPEHLTIGKSTDAMVIEVREKSVLGVTYPTSINTIPTSVLKRLGFLDKGDIALILKYRPFRTAEDLVKAGIGQLKIERLRNLHLI